MKAVYTGGVSFNPNTREVLFIKPQALQGKLQVNSPVFVFTPDAISVGVEIRSMKIDRMIRSGN